MQNISEANPSRLPWSSKAPCMRKGRESSSASCHAPLPLWLSRSFPLPPAPKHIATKSGSSTASKILCWQHDFHTGKKTHSIIRLLSVSTLALLIKSQQKDYSVKSQGFCWISVGVKILLSKNIPVFDKNIWQPACLLRQLGSSPSRLFCFNAILL